MEPIEKRLKSEKQVAVARLQDRVMDSVLAISQSVILHGGTAIWRCYGGKRFSFDLDLYASSMQLRKLLNNLAWELEKRGMAMDYLSFTGHVISIHDEFASIKLEITDKPNGKNSVQKEYVRADGSKMFINTLSDEEFILEKIKAYVSRGYARDLYDIYHLLAFSPKLSMATKKKLRAFVKAILPPKDSKELQELVYEGIAPKFDTMVKYILGAAI